MKIYYAHPISIYNKAQEDRDLSALRALGFTVVNPNSPEHDLGYKQLGMAHFELVVETCDALAFRAFPDGTIPAGVHQEIVHAQKKGKFVIELPSSIERRTLTVAATREFLKEVGAR